MNILETIRRNTRVEHVDDEREIGNGIIITLKRGWTFDWVTDNRVAGADSATAARALITTARAYAGPYHD